MSYLTKTMFALLLLALLLGGCEGARLPPEYTYERHPQRYETLTRPLEALEFDNCNNDAALEQRFMREIAVNETVSLDRAAVQRVGVEVGVSNVATVLGTLEAEISEQFGAGLSSGELQQREVVVYINPNRRATVGLTWLETWEHGYFATFKDGEPLGEVPYSLLKEAELLSHVESFRCGWIGDIEQQWTQGWEQFTALPQVQELWNNRRLELLAAVSGGVLLVLLLLLWRARPRRRRDEFELG